jgi:hypothetical protein
MLSIISIRSKVASKPSKQNFLSMKIVSIIVFKGTNFKFRCTKI